MLTIYSKNTTSFSSLGLGVLKDFTSNPQITEVLNAEYNLEFEYAIDGWLSEYLVEENIIKANGQPFRIWNIQKSTEGSIKILAKHIFFDLEKNFLLDTAPTNTNAQGALNWILDHAEHRTLFRASGDCDIIATARYVRMDPIKAIYSADNALLDRFGGELELDGYDIIAHKKRGVNNGLTIIHRKNLSGAELQVDFSTVATRILPQGKDGLLLPEKFIDSPLINNYFAPLYKKEEFEIGVDEETTEEQAIEKLRNAAKNLFDKEIDRPTISLAVDFIELSKTEEYKNYSSLETAHLGDTVAVILKQLNLNYETRIVKTVYDCLEQRIIELELGSVTPDYVSDQKDKETSLGNTINQINPSSILEQAKKQASDMINHPFNGYIYISYDTGELYLMDNPNVNEAQNVWKFGLGGIGFSKTGISGPYETAWTQEGQIVADFITTGTMSVERISGLTGQLQFIVQNQQALEDSTNGKLAEIDNKTTGIGDRVTDIENNGVSRVETITGTFDLNGLHIMKEGEAMSAILDWQGVVVKRDNTEVLTVRPSGVESENLTARKYLIVKPVRQEKTTAMTDSSEIGLGFFYMGVDS